MTFEPTTHAAFQATLPINGSTTESGFAGIFKRHIHGTRANLSSKIASFPYYEVPGSAATRQMPPVIYLHGLFGIKENWIPVMNHVGHDLRQLSPHLPITELPWSNDCLGDLVDFVVDFMNHLQIPRAILVGNSLGGHVALRMALEHRDRVVALGLCSSSGLYEKEMAKYRPTVSEEFVRSRIEQVFHNPAHVTNDLVAMAYDALLPRDARRRIVSMAKAAKRDNLANRLRHVHVPAVLIWGVHDTITPPSVGMEFQQLLPEAELHWVPDAAHCAQIEQPAIFASHLRSFLDALPARWHHAPEAHHPARHLGLAPALNAAGAV